MCLVFGLGRFSPSKHESIHSIEHRDKFVHILSGKLLSFYHRVFWSPCYLKATQLITGYTIAGEFVAIKWSAIKIRDQTWYLIFDGFGNDLEISWAGIIIDSICNDLEKIQTVKVNLFALSIPLGKVKVDRRWLVISIWVDLVRLNKSLMIAIWSFPLFERDTFDRGKHDRRVIGQYWLFEYQILCG